MVIFVMVKTVLRVLRSGVRVLPFPAKAVVIMIRHDLIPFELYLFDFKNEAFLKSQPYSCGSALRAEKLVHTPFGGDAALHATRE